MDQDKGELSYEEIRLLNIQEKEVFLKELDLFDHEEAVKPAIKPSKGKKGKQGAAEGISSSRKSKRLQDKPGSFLEKVEGARGRESRREGSAVQARARSHPRLRPRPPINYSELEDDHEDDAFLLCTPCGEFKPDGCSQHPPAWRNFSDFTLEVENSFIKGAGQGVINRGDTIPEGVLFGPYSGEFYTKEQYGKLPQSGNAWELYNPSGPGTLGFIDPRNGVKDIQRDWMVKVNCPVDSASQNLIGFQYKREIFYRVCKPIPTGVELLVSYGEDYAKTLGIKTEQMEKYRRREDHRSDGFTCLHCSKVLATAVAFKEHQEKPARGRPRCKGLCAKKKLNRAAVGQTARELSRHEGVHSVKTHSRQVGTSASSYPCPVATCGKIFTTMHHLKEHRVTVHEGRKDFKCPTCGLCFAKASNLSRHQAAIHLKQKLYKCALCTLSFPTAGNLKRHERSVHHGIKQAQYHKKNHYCNTCREEGVTRAFYYPKLLQSHVEKQHPQVAAAMEADFVASHPFVCPVVTCGNRFATKVEVSRHKKKIHEV